MMDRVLWEGIMKGSFRDREAAERIYTEWNEGVKKVGWTWPGSHAL
jgi:hypothetical protein